MKKNKINFDRNIKPRFKTYLNKFQNWRSLIIFTVLLTTTDMTFYKS